MTKKKGQQEYSVFREVQYAPFEAAKQKSILRHNDSGPATVSHCQVWEYSQRLCLAMLLRLTSCEVRSSRASRESISFLTLMNFLPRKTETARNIQHHRHCLVGGSHIQRHHSMAYCMYLVARSGRRWTFDALRQQPNATQIGHLKRQSIGNTSDNGRVSASLRP